MFWNGDPPVAGAPLALKLAEFGANCRKMASLVSEILLSAGTGSTKYSSTLWRSSQDAMNSSSPSSHGLAWWMGAVFIPHFSEEAPKVTDISSEQDETNYVWDSDQEHVMEYFSMQVPTCLRDKTRHLGTRYRSFRNEMMFWGLGQPAVTPVFFKYCKIAYHLSSLSWSSKAGCKVSK